MRQQTLFIPDPNSEGIPPGLRYVPEFLAREEEERMLDYVRALPFREFVMHGMAARRRVIHFGVGYSYSSRDVSSANPIPLELQSLRERATAVAGLAAEALEEVLVTEYRGGAGSTGAGIGWHRDAPPFGVVVGISLGSNCQMRFRRRDDHHCVVRLDLAPGSLYVMDGPARSDWDHMIPAVKSDRYSITFRTLRRARHNL